MNLYSGRSLIAKPWSGIRMEISLVPIWNTEPNWCPWIGMESLFLNYALETESKTACTVDGSTQYSGR